LFAICPLLFPLTTCGIFLSAGIGLSLPTLLRDLPSDFFERGLLATGSLAGFLASGFLLDPFIGFIHGFYVIETASMSGDYNSDGQGGG
jgi:dolichol kinase